MSFRCLFAIGLLLVMALTGSPLYAQQQVPRFGLYEAELQGPADLADPYRDAEVAVTFTAPILAGGKSMEVSGFWDGEKTWRARFSPDVVGLWTWKTKSPRKELDGLAGSFSCIESAGEGRFHVNPGRSRQFAVGTRPLYLLAVEGRVMDMYSMQDGTFPGFVDTRLRQGFNLLYSAATVGLPDSENEGGKAFVDGKLNVKHFQAGDQRVAFCNLKGMVPTLGLDLSGPPDPDQTGTMRLWRYVVARYGAFEVAWTLTGDLDTAVERFAQATRSMDAHGHVLMVVNNGPLAARLGDVVVRTTLDPEWMRADRELTKPALYADYLKENLTGEPVAGLTTDTDAMRRADWLVAMHGGWFVYTGVGPDPRKVQILDSPGARYASIVGQFFRQIDWTALVEAKGMVTEGDAWVLMRPGIEYVVYLPRGGKVGLDLPGLWGTVGVQWFDPRTGTIHDSMRTQARMPLMLTAPDEQDWVVDVFQVK